MYSRQHPARRRSLGAIRRLRFAQTHNVRRLTNPCRVDVYPSQTVRLRFADLSACFGRLDGFGLGIAGHVVPVRSLFDDKLRLYEVLEDVVVAQRRLRLLMCQMRRATPRPRRSNLLLRCH